MAEIENDHIVQTQDEARSGVTGHGVRHVLAFSTIGGAIAVLLVLGWFLL